MIAVVSDIHANLEALEAVLADIARRGISKVYCLGDIVGLGPDPRPCLEIAQSFDVCHSGNWDFFIAGNGDTQSHRSKSELRFWYEHARNVLTRSQLDFLNGNPSILCDCGVTYAHGDPLDSVNGCLFPESISDTDFMERVFDSFAGVFVCGHTHIAGVFSPSRFDEWSQFGNKTITHFQSSIINCGSVGQPRDGDARACYVVQTGSQFQFVRVPYDERKFHRKMQRLNLFK